MTELKPCPFCGGEAKMIKFQKVGSETCEYVMQCWGCHAKTRVCKTDEEAIRAWNRRWNDE